MSIPGLNRRDVQRPFQYLRTLSGHERSPRANRHLGRALAFVAGAANAGGFLAVSEYTSHMTGIVSAMADDIALGNLTLAVAGFVSVLTFVTGAMTCAVLVNWGRERRMHSEYALPLMLEAVLMLVFGLLGARILPHVTLYVSVTVLLLCFMMGLQNAIITKVSRAEIRTTHVTGLVTDIGIGLGRALYWLGRPDRHEGWQDAKRENRARLNLHVSLVMLFFIGAVVGALGFKHIGFQTCIPLAIILMLLSVMPLMDDVLRRNRMPA